MDGDCVGGARSSQDKMVPGEGGEEEKNGRKIPRGGNERRGHVRAQENIYGHGGARKAEMGGGKRGLSNKPTPLRRASRVYSQGSGE